MALILEAFNSSNIRSMYAWFCDIQPKLLLVALSNVDSVIRRASGLLVLFSLKLSEKLI